MTQVQQISEETHSRMEGLTFTVHQDVDIQSEKRDDSNQFLGTFIKDYAIKV